MELNQDIYTWLQSSGVIEEDEEFQDQYYIDEQQAQSLESGYSFSQILSRTIGIFKKLEKNFETKNNITALKPSRNNSSTNFNWTIIKSVLEDLKIEIDHDDIELIKAGSREVLEILLICIYKFEQETLSKISLNTSSSFKIKTVTPSQNYPKAQRNKNGELIIETLSEEIPLDSVESSLEFLLVSFCKHFSLRPKQSAGLLTQSGKYLGYILSRGLKGKHNIIVNWYKDIFDNSYNLSNT